MIVVRFDRELLRTPKKLENLLTASAKQTKLDTINECVLKVFFKKKYVIVKGRTAIGSLKCIFRAINDYSGSKSLNLPEDNLYLHFVQYFWGETRGFTFRVKVLAKNTTHFDLLKQEQQSLWSANNDPNCLNNTIDSYIPLYREETGSYGWISKGHVLNFLKWKNKNSPLQEPAMSDFSDQTGNPSH